MKKNIGVIERDIKTILFSKDYLNTLRSIGFSKEFILNEQVRKMGECVNYLMAVIGESDNAYVYPHENNRIEKILEVKKNGCL